MSGAADTGGLYQAALLARARAPRFATPPARIDARGDATNAFCGDRVTLFASLSADGHLAALGFEAEGCAILTAAADLMAEFLQGRPLGEFPSRAASFRTLIETGAPQPGLDLFQPLAELASYPARRRCALLPWEALAAALADVRRAA